MAAKPLIVRVKTRHGQHRLDTLTGQSTVKDLKCSLQTLTGVDGRLMKILFDYPPRPLDTSDELRTLESFPLKSGDTLIIADETATNHNMPLASAQTQQQRPTAVANRVSDDGARLSNERGAASPGVHHANVINAASPVSAGILLRRVVPSNNSCLFTSVYFCLSGGDYDVNAGAQLRHIIADTVASDEVNYNEGFLGKPNRQYCTWILNEDHWGGAIELSILSKHYAVEIVAVDTQNVRLNRFGEDCNYDSRMLLIYDGIHYDPLMLESLEGTGIRTLFPTTDERTLEMALELAYEAKAARQYTDVKNFTLTCLVCNQGLVGQEQAQLHAKQTGHCNFGEV